MFHSSYSVLSRSQFIRVMPHSEYPSGSGCICTAISQYIDTFLEAEYGVSSIETTWMFEESGSTTTLKDMTELQEVCGKSRLMGGMHFTASVPDSYRLCDGVGPLAYTDLMKGLIGKGSYTELMDVDKEKIFEKSL
jgi:hypothetical protein